MRPRRAITSAIVVGGMIWGGARLVPRASSPSQASQRMETSPVRPRLPAAVQSNQRGHHRRVHPSTARALDAARAGSTTIRPRETRPAGPTLAVGAPLTLP